MGYNPSKQLFGGAGKRADKDSEATAKKMEDLYTGMDEPKFEELDYEKMKGTQTSASRPVESKWEGVSTRDPETRRRQEASMSALDRLAEKGGMTLTDQANLQKAQTSAATADRGRREAIMNRAASQGMTGSGNTLLAELSSSQAATNRDSQAAMDVAGSARERALDATMQSGQLREQDFAEEAKKAAALDTINRFNESGRIGAEQANATLAQATEMFNVRTGNAQQDANNQLLQQEFNNAMAMEAGSAAKYSALLSVFEKRGDRAAANKASILSGIAGIAGAGAQAYSGGGA